MFMKAIDKLLEKSPLLGASHFPQATSYRSERDYEGYGWDFAVVINTDKSPFVGDLPQLQHELNRVGLETYSYYSVERKLIVVKIRASVKRLSEHAASINYSMLLDRHRLEEEARAGTKIVVKLNVDFTY